MAGTAGAAEMASQRMGLTTLRAQHGPHVAS